MNLDPRNPYENFFVFASAGSGKTYQLSQRFLYLVAAGADPAKILTLTFTRKAAAEMKGSGGTPIAFLIEEVTVNFEVVMTNSALGSGKLSFWVASAEAQGKLDQSARHSIALKLRVDRAADGTTLTFGRR